MPIYKKFVGLSGDAVALTANELAAKFGIPGSMCICFNITSEGNYSIQKMIKKTNVLQVPMIPPSKFELLQLLKDIGIDVNTLNIVENVDPETVELEHAGEIE